MSKTNQPAKWEEYEDHFAPIQIEVGGNFEASLRNFKAMVQKSKILSDYKACQSFEKPSEQKRRKRRESKERQRILQIKRNEYEFDM